MIEMFQFVLSWIAESRWAWVAEASALAILSVTTIFFVAAGFYSRPVQRLLMDMKRAILFASNRARDASISPYDRNPEDIKAVAWCMVIWYYVIASFALVNSIPLLLAFSGFLGPEDLSFYKRISALAVALIIFFYARLTKVEGDKILFKIKSK